jgi:hypothetical protein
MEKSRNARTAHLVGLQTAQSYAPRNNKAKTSTNRGEYSFNRKIYISSESRARARQLGYLAVAISYGQRFDGRAASQRPWIGR